MWGANHFWNRLPPGAALIWQKRNEHALGTFLSDADRLWLSRLGLLERTDTVHDPYLPAAFTLGPDLRIHRAYNGYWYFGRPTHDELQRDMREITMAVREDWEAPGA